MIFGRSVWGRPIEAQPFLLTPRDPLSGAIHGDEPLGIYCLERLAEELARETLSREVWIVPVVNPDGLAADRKQNARNVDLNRNFPAKSWRAAHEPNYFPGDAPASEPETQALLGLIERIGATRIITLHSPFRTVNYDGPARALAERMATANGYGATHDIVTRRQCRSRVLRRGSRPRGHHPRDPADDARAGVAGEPIGPARRLRPVTSCHMMDVDSLGEVELLELAARIDARLIAIKAPPTSTRDDYDAIIGRARPMLDLFRTMDRVVDSESTVLIQGENGTGKELVAKAIHGNSVRRDQRFVIQNCSAFNDNLLDSELFGHKKGAFTGAIADKQGLFEIADGGTIFLDEIGDMSPALQVEVLRVIQEGTFTPVGDTVVRQVDVRIIAATNRDLKRMVERGEFREDLFYRVNVINLTMPPLRDRKDDITLLVDTFLRKHGRGRRAGKRLSRACFDRMLAYNWPGNVRELENEIERLVVLAGEEKIIEEACCRRGSASRGRADGGHRGAARRRGDPREAHDRRGAPSAPRQQDAGGAELRISRRNLIRLVASYGLEARGRQGGGPGDFVNRHPCCNRTETGVPE